MFVASYHNTLRGARRILAEKQSQNKPPMQIYGIRREWPASPALPLTVREIMARVAVWHGLTIDDLRSHHRRMKWKDARRDALFAVKRAYPQLSLATLGRLFNRHHTTILHHLQSVGLA